MPEDTIKPNTNITKDPKGKSMIGGSAKQGAKVTQCHRCHGYGHIVAQCPSRNLLVERAYLDDDEFVEIYKSMGSASDTNEDVRVSHIQLSVVRCLHAASKNED